MPFVGEVDIAGIIATLGDPSHGLYPAGPARNTQTQDEEHIYAATWGIAEWSTRTTLVRPCEPIWDTNSYYRALGLRWPYRDGKKALRLAYQSSQGQDSEYLTYVFKQLLNPDVRKAYDATPLGQRFRDRYTDHEKYVQLAKAAGALSEEEGRIVTVEELLEHSYQSRPKLPELSPGAMSWAWGYYLLQSRKETLEDLIEWQRLLIQACTDQHLVCILAIGYIGKTYQQCVEKKWKGNTILFLNENTIPTLELAETAVSKIRLRK